MQYEIQGLRQLEEAIKRNPAYVVKRTNTFLTRGLAEYRRVIMRQPWRIGDDRGGAPVATGNLRDTHRSEVHDLEGRIYPTAPYAKFVHGVTGFARRRSYALRPWLDYAAAKALPDIEQHEKDLLEDIVKNLAS